MHSQTRLALVLSALVCSLAGMGSAEDKNDASVAATYRSSVSEVRVTFFANDERNRPLENLSKADFAIVDDERIVRNFRSFSHSDETSLDIVVLVDLSESVAPRSRSAMNEVLRLVAQEQTRGDDNIAVLSFGGNHGGSIRRHLQAEDTAASVVCLGGCRGADAVANLLSMRGGASTPLYDALIFASDFIVERRRNSVRPVVILFSDGEDTISLHSRDEAVQAVRRAAALFYAVDVGTPKPQEVRPDSFLSGSVFLRQLSQVSGGRYFSFAEVSSLPEGSAGVLNAALEDLRASYIVTYDLPTHHTGFHSLRLLPTHNLNLTFHSRDGYDYEPFQ